MKNLECKAIKDFNWNITSIILFGLVISVYNKNQAYKVLNNKVNYYCSATDKDGNIYNIYSDYDPGLQISYTVAIIKE